ncbi:hypothetical protein AAFN60_21325 [Roseibacillus persicicus]|uniref:hypothetical protein n=1 Tax=Roseibacillus persicicus TaxID=454148 RepID=UPI00398BA2ED
MRHSNWIAALAIVVAITLSLIGYEGEIDFYMLSGKAFWIFLAFLVWRFPRRTGLWIAGFITFSIFWQYHTVSGYLNEYIAKNGGELKQGFWTKYWIQNLPHFVGLVFSILAWKAYRVGDN